MKVLHVSDAIDPSRGGGTAERTFQLALALRRGGNSCTILCTELGLGENRRMELEGVPLIAVATWFNRYLIPLISRRRIEQLVANADVIHVTGHWSMLGARVCLAAKRMGKPYVYCPAGSLRVFGRSAWLKRIYNWLVGHRIVRGASCCLSVTELEREQFHEYGIPDERIVLIPNGVHPDPNLVPAPEAFRTQYDLKEKQVLLFLGRLNPIKGPDLLLEAFASLAQAHPEAILVFAGPDEEMGVSLREQVELLGLTKRVLFIGFISGQAKQDALAAADFLVVPSRQEAMSLVALEAGLCRTPVLLTDQCGFDEVEEVGGGLVVAAQAEAIAAGIDQLLSDACELPRMGERLQQLVLARYTWDGINRQVCELYKMLTGIPHPLTLPSFNEQK